MINRAVSLLLLIFFLMTNLPEAGAALLNNPGLLSSSDLNRHPNDWVILDARPEKVFAVEHIPGSMPFSWESCTYTDREGVRFRMFPLEKMAEIIASRGIGPRDDLVVYGDADTSWGGEGWVCWLLAYLGHQGKIRLLAGGIKAWKEGGYPTVAGGPRDNALGRGRYPVTPNNTINISAEQLQAHPERFMLVDVRSPVEWAMGHIPGAAFISWKNFFSDAGGSPLAGGELADLLKAHGYRGERVVVYYCTGGIRSGFAWLVHKLGGLGPAVNFEGGIEEWNVNK